MRAAKIGRPITVETTNAFGVTLDKETRRLLIERAVKDYDGNLSMALRHIIREWAETNGISVKKDKP